MSNYNYDHVWNELATIPTRLRTKILPPLKTIASNFDVSQAQNQDHNQKSGPDEPVDFNSIYVLDNPDIFTKLGLIKAPSNGDKVTMSDVQQDKVDKMKPKVESINRALFVFKKHESDLYDKIKNVYG